MTAVPPKKNHPWRKAAPRWTHNVQLVRLAFPPFTDTIHHEKLIAFDKCEEAASEIERLRELVSASYRLREERDEARRMVCGLDADIMEDQVEYARHRGWDCFPREDGK